MTKDRGAKAPPTAATDLDIDTLRELTGTPPLDRQGVVFDTTEVQTRPTGVTDQELDEGESGLTDEFGAIVSADQLGAARGHRPAVRRDR